MAKIPEYNFAPNEAKLRPSPDAVAAFETAARRIGPLLNQAGQDYKEIGRVQAADIRGQDFPLEFAAFADAATGEAARTRAPSGGLENFRVQGGTGGFGGGGGGSSGGAGRSNPSSSQRNNPSGAAAQLVSTWADLTSQAGPAVLRGNGRNSQNAPPGSILNPQDSVTSEMRDMNASSGGPGYVMSPYEQGMAEQYQYNDAVNGTVPSGDERLNKLIDSLAPPTPPDVSGESSWLDSLRGAVNSAIGSVGGLFGGDYTPGEGSY